jgi:hypothetical protein
MKKRNFRILRTLSFKTNSQSPWISNSELPIHLFWNYVYKSWCDKLIGRILWCQTASWEEELSGHRGNILPNTQKQSNGAPSLCVARSLNVVSLFMPIKGSYQHYVSIGHLMGIKKWALHLPLGQRLTKEFMKFLFYYILILIILQ